MDLKGDIASRFVRVIAIIALLLGLSDASRLLGVTPGSGSPIAEFGVTAFAYLAVFCLARLFASVGLWIGASWGAVLLVGATLIELGLYAFGSPDVSMSVFGLAVRIILIVGIGGLLLLQLRLRRAHD
jgi:hypothetical protein